jgi:hypothetical protein
MGVDRKSMLQEVGRLGIEQARRLRRDAQPGRMRFEALDSKARAADLF